MLLGEIVLIEFLNKFLLIPEFLSLLLKAVRLKFLPCVELHLAENSLLTVVDHGLLGIHDLHLLVKAAELVPKHEVDLILVLLIQVVVIADQLALQSHSNPVLVNDVPSFLVSRKVVVLAMLKLLAFQFSRSGLFPQLCLLLFLLFDKLRHA